MKIWLFVITLLCMTLSTYTQITKEEYINHYKNLAISEMERTGIPAAIKMAQAIVESNAGNSYLANVANNHFGIKCKVEWKGERVYYDDDDDDKCFRKYDSVEESYIDHSNFLLTRSRYSFLFDLNPLDYKAWAHGLKEAGYATNPNYGEILIKCVEENNLNELSIISE